MKKYLSYKDSEVGWIGEIPNTWKVSRVKKYFNERNEKVSDLDFPPLSVTKRGILPQLDNVSKSDNHNDRKRVCKNDFVINSRSDRKGSSGMSLLDGSVSLINIVLEPKSIIPKYSQYIFKSKDFIEEFFRNGKGIHWDLWSTRFSELQDIKIPIPPLSEQQQIVSFLDTKTSLIDSLIEKNQRKIELLKEKKTSLINEVVIKGLNPNVEMKDSDVKWIGKIPSTWKKISLGKVGTLYGGLTGKSGEDFRSDNHPMNKPFIPFTNIFKNTYISKNHFQNVVVEENENQNRVKKFDLFFLMSSEEYDDLGKSSILIEDVDELYLNSFCKGFRITREDVYPLFLNYQLLSYTHKKLISVEGNGFTRINLRQDRLKETPVFIPSNSEQQQIVEYLDEQTGLIDKTITIHKKRVELLKEYRQSLISEVVTGKQKVV